MRKVACSCYCSASERRIQSYALNFVSRRTLSVALSPRRHCLLRRYYPPPTSISQVTPAWWQAPPGDNVTILFTFVEGASRMKARNQAAYSHALQQMQDVVRPLPAWAALGCCARRIVAQMPALH